MNAIDGIAQVAISVTDVPRATAFYRDALGLKVQFSPSPQMVFFDCGGIRLLISDQGGTPGAAGTLVYFKTASVRALHKAIVERGVQFEQAPHLIAQLSGREIWLAALKDPDGNLLHLMSEERPA